MKIYLLVVTSDSSLRQYVGTQKHRTFPEDSLRRGFFSSFKVRAIVNAVDARDFNNSSELEALVADRANDIDCLLIMIDKDRACLAEDIRSAAMVCEIDTARAIKSYQNYLHERLGKLVKALNCLAPLFNDGTDSVLLSLPLRNFKCSALSDLDCHIMNDPCSPELSNLIDVKLQRVRRRVRPRKKSNYKTKYAVDGQKRFFVFGKEHHSLPETGAPHRTYCKINANFRFGCRIDHDRHYNVSEGESDKTHVSGQFFDCHGQEHTVKGKTHINMFSNDYF